MAKQYKIDSNTIFCINDDGTASSVASIDRKGDITPNGKNLSYSQMEKEINNLSNVKEQSEHLRTLVTNLNKDITKVKQAATKFTSIYRTSLFNKFPSWKSFFKYVGFFLLILISSAVIVFLYDIFNISHPVLIEKIKFIKIVFVVLSIFFAFAFIYLFLIASRVYKALDELESSSEKLAHIQLSDDMTVANQDVDFSNIPLVISKVEIANTYSSGNIQTNYGQSIHSKDTMYLKPKLRYFGIKSGISTLRVRWIRPNGTISTGDNSIGDFSQIAGHQIETGKWSDLILSGWGNSTKGHWPAGQYFIEIWSDEVRLIRAPFTIV